MGDSLLEEFSQPPFPVRLANTIGVKYQYYLDKSVPYQNIRWLITLLMLSLYGMRVFYLQGFYIITYALAIYYLNLFIAFLSPKIDPAFSDDDDDNNYSLPTKGNEEFRPFIRRLPEFKFWHSSTKACLLATFLTFFEIFNVPVFWPILVMYFIILFCITMKRQIRHMIKYRYLPFTHGKTRYSGKD